MGMREIAEEAERILSEEGWWKGGEPRNGVPCLGLALSKACPVQAQILVSRLVVEIADILFPERYVRTIPAFNDHPDTTRENVSLVLKHLAEET
jgi:hypothetical protein